MTLRHVLGLVGALLLVVIAFAVLIVDWRTIGPSDVALTVEAELRGNILTISGETDLPDGTTLNWDAAKDSFGAVGPNISGTATVVAGRFLAEQRFVSLAPGTQVVVAVRFYPGADQPKQAIDRFGEDGERLRGPGLRYDSEAPLWRVEGRFTVQQ
jgi:hypothetical protein